MTNIRKVREKLRCSGKCEVGLWREVRGSEVNL